MHRGYVEGYCKKSWQIGREHSTYCGKNLGCDHPVSQYSISLRTCHFGHQDDVIDQCWPVIVVYWSVLHLILDSTWVWYSLLLELKIPTLVWHWNCLLRLRRWEGHSLQVMRTQLETLGEEFKLAGNIWWREPTILWGLDPEMHWHCEDNGHIWASYLSESFVMRCFGIVRTIPTSSSSWPMDHTLDLMVCILSFLRWLWLSLWGRHCLDKTLVYIVDWLLQWSKDFSDTTVFGWPTLTMSNRTFYSPLRLETVRCYLYVENWFGERTLCSDYTLYPEEGCTDTLCESLRSWEVSQLVTNELVIHVWMRTSLIWELLEVFRWFWIHLVKLSFVDF